MDHNRPRQRAGLPDGGLFAAAPRSEGDVGLGHASARNEGAQQPVPVTTPARTGMADPGEAYQPNTLSFEQLVSPTLRCANCGELLRFTFDGDRWLHDGTGRRRCRAVER